MQLSVTLLLVFVTGALTGPEPTEDVTQSTNRGQRLLLKPLLTLIGLGGASVSVSKAPPVPSVVYVQLPSPKTCPRPYAVVGCPVGYICSAAYNCIPRKPTGAPCTTGYECLGGNCRDQVCVKDLCQTAVWRSGCPPGQTCVSTYTGYACRSKVDSCHPPLAFGNCPAGNYCSSDRVCTPQLPVNAACQKNQQCEHSICRNYRCKDDQCPTIDSSQDCQLYEYCTSSANGNVCRAKRADDEPCDAENQCNSNTCKRNRCVTNECELSSNHSDCSDDQYCMESQEGNVCLGKLDKEEQCSDDQQCRSGRCAHGYCYEDECSELLTETEECPLYQICLATPLGNRCMLQLPEEAYCTENIECLSGNCQPQSAPSSVDSVCQPSLANGEECDADRQCSSGRCSGNQCSV